MMTVQNSRRGGTWKDLDGMQYPRLEISYRGEESKRLAVWLSMPNSDHDQRMSLRLDKRKEAA